MREAQEDVSVMRIRSMEGAEGWKGIVRGNDACKGM